MTFRKILKNEFSPIENIVLIRMRKAKHWSRTGWTEAGNRMPLNRFFREKPWFFL